LPSDGQTTVLIVEDHEPNLQLLKMILRKEGYELLTARDGEEGFAILLERAGAVDAVLLDLNLPKLDGYAFLKQMNANSQLAHIPVIVQTADNSAKALKKVTELGVYFFLTKPIDAEVCRSVLRSAINDSLKYNEALHRVNRTEQSIRLMDSASFRFRTEKDALTLAATLSLICPSPRRQMLGLSELMVNAIEHGNLSIHQEEKRRLIEEGGLAEEIERRLALPEYGTRWANIEITRDEDQLTFVITDQGDGFDWSYEERESSQKLTQPLGRGIALAKTIAFDAVEYQGVGNQVIAKISGETNGGAASSSGNDSSWDEVNSDGFENLVRDAQTAVVKFLANVEEELVTAATMQKRYLPDQAELEELETAYKLDLSSFYRPCEELGGDYWGAVAIDENRLAIFIADFSSDGAEAAASTIWLDGAIRIIIGTTPSPKDFLPALNESMVKRASGGSYATMLYGILDLDQGMFTYATAGAPLPVALLANEGKAVMAEGKGLPLGVVPGAQYSEWELSVPEGASLLLYSDGIIENPNLAGAIIGRAGAPEYFQEVMVSEPGHVGAKQFLDRFLSDTKQPPIDDATLICCRRISD